MHPFDSNRRSISRVLLAAAFAAASAVAASRVPAAAATAFAPPPSADDILDVPDAAGVRDIGRTAANSPIDLAVNLKYRHDDEIDRDLALQGTPGSQFYGHFLSNAEWNGYFAPAPDTVARVSAALSRAGFRVVALSSDRSVIDVTGPVAAAERYFSTEIHNVVQPGAGVRYRNARIATMPAELRPYVNGVTGLDDLQLVAPRPMPHGARIDAIGGPFKAPDGGYGPVVLANGYSYPVQSGHDGSGRSVGITIPGNFLDSDLAAYLAYFGIKQTGKVTRVSVNGAHFSGPEAETTLDVETISGLAPGANIYIYQFASFTPKPVNDAFSKVVSDNIVDSFSNSWGWCETKTGALWNEKSIHALFRQAEIKGITPIFSSGDDGAFTRGCNGALRVASPADDPNVVAVGGLTIAVDKTGKLTGSTGWSGSGGGVSVVYKQPAYQHGVAGTIASGRSVPDIALPADVQDAWYIQGGWNGPQGGTSWSAPAFNAMLAEIDQVRGKRAGFVNPLLYKAAATSGSAVFTDITAGNNGHYAAGPGYDEVTGLGAPVGTGLAKGL